MVVPEAELARVPASWRAARGRGAARGDGRGNAARREARRRRRDRGGADRACDRLRAGGSGSSGSAARGSLRTGCSRTRGAPRSAAGTGMRRRISALATRGVEIRVSAEPEVPDGWEVFVSSAYPSVAGRPRAELLAELVSLRRFDRRRRRAREDDHGGDDRVRAARDRPRPALDRRRRGAAARRERRCGGGLARRRGRRVGPLGVALRPRDRGRC